MCKGSFSRLVMQAVLSGTTHQHAPDSVDNKSEITENGSADTISLDAVPLETRASKFTMGGGDSDESDDPLTDAEPNYVRLNRFVLELFSGIIFNILQLQSLGKS